MSSLTTPADSGTVGENHAERIARLRESAYRIRRYALDMAEVQGQGYIGQALGVADILAVLYKDQLRLRPDDPQSACTRPWRRLACSRSPS